MLKFSPTVADAVDTFSGGSLITTTPEMRTFVTLRENRDR